MGLKVHYKTRDGRMVFEITGETAKDLFRGVAQVQDIFEADSGCGLCQSQRIRFSSRTVDDNDYYQMVCLDCSAQLDFGQHKKGGTLFPKRKGAQGDWLPAGGWHKLARSSK